MTSRLAWRPVGTVLLGYAALFTLVVNQYGYHRDELYFRLLAGHPAWGYVDQPPLTPMTAKVGIAVFGDNLWGIRVPAMLLALTAIALTALLTAELSGGPLAQTLAAIGMAGPFLLVNGHMLLTSSADMVVWLLVILFAARALRRGQPRWWLAAGLTVGLGLFNKQLVVLLMVGLGVGLLIAGPRRELRSPWLWAGVAIALVVGLPNVAYQIASGWPQVTMARAISRYKGHDDRLFFVPFQLILLAVVTPVWISGLVRLLRDPAWRPLRALAWAYPVVCLIVLATGGQPYYTFGLMAFYYAAGCVSLAGWARGRRIRGAWTGALLAVNLLIGVVSALPLIPVRSLPAAVTTANQSARDSIGWPTYVRQVADVYRSLPDADRAGAVLIAGNYGEAGALDRFGPGYRLPPTYSGHNELYRFGPPPDRYTVAIEINEGPSVLAAHFDTCTRAGTLDNGVGVDNEEQGAAITVCRGRHGSWSSFWSTLRHYS